MGRRKASLNIIHHPLSWDVCGACDLCRIRLWTVSSAPAVYLTLVVQWSTRSLTHSLPQGPGPVPYSGHKRTLLITNCKRVRVPRPGNVGVDKNVHKHSLLAALMSVCYANSRTHSQLITLLARNLHRTAQHGIYLIA